MDIQSKKYHKIVTTRIVVNERDECSQLPYSTRDDRAVHYLASIHLRSRFKSFKSEYIAQGKGATVHCLHGQAYHLNAITKRFSQN